MGSFQMEIQGIPGLLPARRGRDEVGAGAGEAFCCCDAVPLPIGTDYTPRGVWHGAVLFPAPRTLPRDPA